MRRVDEGDDIEGSASNSLKGFLHPGFLSNQLRIFSLAFASPGD